jgi:uncharacterized protein (DUF1697 family)
MDELRGLYQSLGLKDLRTYIQSGNLVFRTQQRNLTTLAERIKAEIEEAFAVNSPVILRTLSAWRAVIARNPFAREPNIDKSKLLVSFCSTVPTGEDLSRIRAIECDSEKLVVHGAEIFSYHPNGLGRSKVATTLMGRGLKLTATARNWNTVLQLERMAAELDANC